MAASIDGYILGRMRSAWIPGLALVVVENDEIVYARGYGRADPTGRPITPQPPVIIGSISKPFTALAVLQLVDAGQVGLDDPVQQYLPWFQVANPQVSAHITVRHLLNQTSGLPQTLEAQLVTGEDPGALEENVRALASVELVGAPGQTFAYSNANYATLGVLVEAVSGMSFGEYIQTHIFSPLEMEHSFTSQAEAMSHGMATGYRWWFGVPAPVTLPYHAGELPGGYLISSAEDMGRFLIAQLNDGRYLDARLLSAQGVAQMHAAATEHPYGMGWEAIQVNGRTLINHDGGVPNFQASLFFDPAARVGVFVAANVDGALDTFSSPPGADFRDGPTVRTIALSVLELAKEHPLPPQGIGHARLYLVYDLLLLALTAWLVFSLLRLPAWHAQLLQSGVLTMREFATRAGLVVLSHFTLPALVYYLALRSTSWKALVMLYQPDLGWWLLVAATILLIKGLAKVGWLWRAFSPTV